MTITRTNLRLTKSLITFLEGNTAPELCYVRGKINYHSIKLWFDTDHWYARKYGFCDYTPILILHGNAWEAFWQLIKKIDNVQYHDTVVDQRHPVSTLFKHFFGLDGLAYQSQYFQIILTVQCIKELYFALKRRQRLLELLELLSPAEQAKHLLELSEIFDRALIYEQEYNFRIGQHVRDVLYSEECSLRVEDRKLFNPKKSKMAKGRGVIFDILGSEYQTDSLDFSPLSFAGLWIDLRVKPREFGLRVALAYDDERVSDARNKDEHIMHNTIDALLYFGISHHFRLNENMRTWLATVGAPHSTDSTRVFVAAEIIKEHIQQAVLSR